MLTQAEWEAKQGSAGGDSSGKGKRGDGGSRGQGRGRGGTGGGRGGRSDDGKEGTGKRDKSHIKCHDFGHYANRCPSEKEEEEAHCARIDREPSMLLAEAVLSDKLQCSEDRQVQKLFLNETKVVPELHITDGGDPTGDVWYLDNGASNHMSGDRQKFRDLNLAINGKVRFGDDSTVDICGRGTIVFQGKGGDQWVLSDVYYIPKLRSLGIGFYLMMICLK
jgi:hypothetical protein